jgi:hypothetical protein
VLIMRPMRLAQVERKSVELLASLSRRYVSKVR